eukprot:364380-Chlamydomonas_euryale.AAC.6
MALPRPEALHGSLVAVAAPSTWRRHAGNAHGDTLTHDFTAVARLFNADYAEKKTAVRWSPRGGVKGNAYVPNPRDCPHKLAPTCGHYFLRGCAGDTANRLAGPSSHGKVVRRNSVPLCAAGRRQRARVCWHSHHRADHGQLRVPGERRRQTRALMCSLFCVLTSLGAVNDRQRMNELPDHVDATGTDTQSRL